MVSSEIRSLVQNLCSQHAILSSTVKTPDLLCVYFFTAAHTLLYKSLHCLWTRESRKKINKKFYNICFIFYKTHRKQCAVIPSFVLLSNSTGNSENQKQVLNVYFLAGLNSVTNWCSNELVSICASALGFFLITFCLMNLLNNHWSMCQNSFV